MSFLPGSGLSSWGSTLASGAAVLPGQDSQFPVRIVIAYLLSEQKDCKIFVVTGQPVFNPLCSSRLNLYDDIDEFTVKLFSVQFSSGFF